MSADSTANSKAAGAVAGGLYTRQSSGLVRDISPISNVGLNIAFVSIPLAALVATQAPFAFPGTAGSRDLSQPVFHPTHKRTLLQFLLGGGGGLCDLPQATHQPEAEPTVTQPVTTYVVA